MELWKKVRETVMDTPSIRVPAEEFIAYLKENTQEARAERIKSKVFVCDSSQYRNFDKLEERNFVIPLFSDYYRAKDQMKYDRWRDRIEIPVRSTHCGHADVSDLKLILPIFQNENPQCPICGVSLDLGSLYIDKRVYSALLNDPDGKLVLLPMVNKTGCDPHLVKSLTDQDIEKIHNKAKKSAATYTAVVKSSKQEKRLTSTNSPAYLLTPLRYNGISSMVQFSLNKCSAHDEAKSVFLFHLLFAQQEAQCETINTLFSMSNGVVYKEFATADLFYFCREEGGVQTDVLQARDVLMLSIGLHVSHGLVLYVDMEGVETMLGYLEMLSEFFAPKSFPSIKLFFLNEDGERKRREELMKVLDEKEYLDGKIEVEFEPLTAETLSKYRLEILMNALEEVGVAGIPIYSVIPAIEHRESIVSKIMTLRTEGKATEIRGWRMTSSAGDKKRNRKFTYSLPLGVPAMTLTYNTSYSDYFADLTITPNSPTSARILLSYHALHNLTHGAPIFLVNPKTKRLCSRAHPNSVFLYLNSLSREEQKEGPGKGAGKDIRMEQFLINLVVYISQMQVVTDGCEDGKRLASEVLREKQLSIMARQKKLLIMSRNQSLDEVCKRYYEGLLNANVGHVAKKARIRSVDSFKMLSDDFLNVDFIAGDELFAEFDKYLALGRVESRVVTVADSFLRFLSCSIASLLPALPMKKWRFELQEDHRDEFYGVSYCLTLLPPPPK